MIINGEIYLPIYKYVNMGYCSAGFYVMYGWKKIEKREDVENRYLKDSDN